MSRRLDGGSQGAEVPALPVPERTLLNDCNHCAGLEEAFLELTAAPRA